MLVYGIPDIVTLVVFPDTLYNCVPSDECTCRLYPIINPLLSSIVGGVQ